MVKNLFDKNGSLARLFVILSTVITSSQSCTGAWLGQDTSQGFGILRMADDQFVGRFGGGGWGRLNGTDFDGDGDTDLVVTFGAGGGAKGTYSGLFVYKNIGSAEGGLLGPGQQLAHHEQIQATTPFVGDANGDSSPDIFCNGLLFLNQSSSGRIRFAPPRGSADPYWHHPTVYDWNGDGVQDLFEEHRWELRWSNGHTGKTTTLDVGGQNLLTDIFIRPYVCDWDNDGDPDILIGQESGHITFVENRGGKLLAEKYVQQASPNAHSGCASVPSLCDWDGDGDKDLIVGNAAGFLEYFEYHTGRFKGVQRLHADGQEIRILAGEFGSVQGPGEARWGYASPAVADWDLDGDLDLLVGCVTGENLLFKNIGSRTQARLAGAEKLTVDWGRTEPVYPDGIRFSPEPNVLVTQWRCRPVVMDWNRDGLPDFLTVDAKGFLACYPRFKREDGSLGLSPPEYMFRDQDGAPLHFCSHPKPGRNGRIKFTFADWDGDGDLDIIRSAGHEDGTQNLDNQGNFTYLECVGRDANHQAFFKWQGELVKSKEIRLQGHTASPIVFDVDGNGTLDILSGCEDGNLYWFLREWIENP